MRRYTGVYGIVMLHTAGQSPYSCRLDEDTCTHSKNVDTRMLHSTFKCVTPNRSETRPRHVLLRVRVCMYVLFIHYSAQNPRLVGNIQVGCWTVLAPRANKGHSHGPWPNLPSSPSLCRALPSLPARLDGFSLYSEPV